MSNASRTKRTKPIEAPEWFFMWSSGEPYICAIVGWSRRAVIQEAEKSQGRSWKEIYRQGGRAIRCSVRPK